MTQQEKIEGSERRRLIVKWLKESTSPIPGREIAERTHVSRQVIVQDISLLKASDEPIIATNRGYLYVQEEEDDPLFKKVIVCKHDKTRTEEELNIIVDYGCTVVDVIIEHAIYGELTGSLMINSRFDVKQFIEDVNKENATLLSRLTDGIHLHTIEADSMEKIDAACQALEEAGFLIKED